MPNTQGEKVIRVGSRKSELALIQTKYVIGRLQRLYPNKKFEIHTMSTIGDRVLNISLPKIGEKSLFTRDLEDALRNGGVDFVVHSLKDLPTALPTGMAVGAVLEREDARDALVLRENYRGHTIATLPEGSVLGTSSLRRTAQIRRQYPHLVVCDIRGNLNTRLAKLDAPDSKFAGIILAQAGLVRMGWINRISQVLEPTDLLYAVGQGALAVECRAHDNVILEMLQKLMCLPTTCRILAERSFLKTLGGGCSAPVAVWSNLNGKLTAQQSATAVGLTLTGAVWSLDGAVEIREKLACTLKEQPLKRVLSAEHDNDVNKNGTDSGVGNGNDSSTSNDSPPPMKRQRHEDADSNSNSPRQRHSPPVINDDADVEQLSATYNVGELIERHIDLVKKCPVIRAGELAHDPNGNAKVVVNGSIGGGDADSSANVTVIENVHCPLPINVGQDVMGQCPFVDNETKVNYASAGKCPITSHTATAGGDEVDNGMPTTSSKCPFAALHNRKGLEFSNTTPMVTNNNDSSTKCPFLQKTVQMFDYSDEEKPQPQKLDVLIEDVDNLFCGLYQHACYSRELYVRSNKLGKELADELIKKGALDIMKIAQSEIHNKAT